MESMKPTTLSAATCSSVAPWSGRASKPPLGAAEKRQGRRKSAKFAEQIVDRLLFDPEGVGTSLQGARRVLELVHCIPEPRGGRRKAGRGDPAAADGYVGGMTCLSLVAAQIFRTPAVWQASGTQPRTRGTCEHVVGAVCHVDAGASLLCGPRRPTLESGLQPQGVGSRSFREGLISLLLLRGTLIFCIPLIWHLPPAD